MSSKYLCTCHISNTGGIGIKEIDIANYSISFDIVTDKVLSSHETGLIDYNDLTESEQKDIDETDDGPFFRWGEMVLSINNFTTI